MFVPISDATLSILAGGSRHRSAAFQGGIWGGIDGNGHDPGSNLTVTVAPLSPGAALKDSATIYPTPLRGIMFF